MWEGEGASGSTYVLALRKTLYPLLRTGTAQGISDVTGKCDQDIKHLHKQHIIPCSELITKVFLLFTCATKSGFLATRSRA